MDWHFAEQLSAAELQSNASLEKSGLGDNWALTFSILSFAANMFLNEIGVWVSFRKKTNKQTNK